MNQKTHSIKFNFIMNSILTVSSFIFPIITFPYISRILTPSGTGKVNFAISFIAYFTMIAQLGVPTYGVRACAQVRDNKIKLSKVTQELLIINLLMSVISYAAFFIIVFTVPQLTEERTLYIITSANIILNVVGMEWLYKGLEQYSYITGRSLIMKVISLIAMFALVHAKDDYVIYGSISVFAGAASNVLNVVHAKKYIMFKPTGGYELKKHLKAVSIFFAMTCATTVYTNMDNVMLKFITNNDIEVGYYSAATKIKLIMATIVSSLGTVLLPRVSYYIVNNMMEEFKKIAAKALNFVVLISMPLCIYFMLFARESILLIAGNQYEGAIIPMIVIMPSIIFIGLSNILGIQILVPMGKEVYVLYSEIIGAVTDLVLNIILIPIMSSTGAAIGTLIAESAVFLFQFYILRNSVIPIIKKIPFYKIIVALIAAVLVSVPVLFFTWATFWKLLLSACLFFCIYGIILLLFKEPLVIELLKGMLNKIHAKKGNS